MTDQDPRDLTFVSELLAALRQVRLTLPEALNAIVARGPRSESIHSTDLDQLEKARHAGGYDPEVLLALKTRLIAVQAVVAPLNDTDDATVVMPRKPRIETIKDVHLPPQTPPEEDDKTVVKPVNRSSGNDEITIVVPATTGMKDAMRRQSEDLGNGDLPGAGTSGSMSGSSSTWRRIADAETGEFATVGMLLKGRFLLEREIGRGGMGVVYLARDERKVEARDRDPYVAVKVLNDDFRRHPDSLIALQREARRSQLLAHDNIVRVFDFDKDGTIVFMTMEYLDGSDLKTIIRERAYNGMPLVSARPLIEGMASALRRAHAAGVVHSDFKPGNVLVTREGVPKVFDFGIARAAHHVTGEIGDDKTVFDAGTLGALTPAYASLEMIQGKEPTSADDIYALGCVIFELLTGKHPFDRKSAEVAQREKLTPPAVAGLTRRQYKALCDSVAFTRAQRLSTVDQLIDGLRDISLRQRYGGSMLYGAGAIAVLGLVGWGVSHFLYERHVHSVIARLSPKDPHHYVSVRAALSALNGLSRETRTDIVLADGTRIQNFFLNRIRSYWDPAKKRFDFMGAEHVFQARDQLRLYSPILDRERRRIDRERNALLNTLDIQLMNRISRGAIFNSQPHNVVTTWMEMKSLDPTSVLLDNRQLEIQYDIAIGRALASGHVERAQRRLLLAERLFPAARRFVVRSQQVASLQSSERISAAPITEQFQTEAQAQAALAQVVAAPQETVMWQSRVASAMAMLAHNSSPQVQLLVAKLGDAIAGMVSQTTDVSKLPQDIQLVNFGLHYAPFSRELNAQRARLANLQEQQQMKLNQEAATAEIAARIQLVQRAAADNDPTEAEQSLASIRALQPTNSFVQQQGPALIAAAYMRMAHTAVRNGQYRKAQQILTQGVVNLGALPTLIHARDLYSLTAVLLGARGEPFAQATYQQLKARLAYIQSVDARGVQDLEDELRKRGQLPEGTLSGLLSSLKPGNIPEILPTVVQSAEISSSVPTIRQGSCTQPGMAGSGRICFSLFHDGHRGPQMVVIPGMPGGGRPYAMSRADITVDQFNAFCVATHQCKPVALPYSFAGALPITDISIAQAKAYVQWLTRETGDTYRLPTNAEWLYAARANVNWKQAPDSDCLPPSSTGNNGAGGPIAALGRDANPWGLVNMTGDVWQWVLLPGGGVGERGGSFNSYWSSCTVAAYRSASGAPQGDTGFRVLRILK